MTTRKKSDAMKFLEKLTGGKLTLASLLEAHRQSEEMSQAEFAKILGVSASHLCDIEKGRKVVSPERAAKFARILQLSERQFVRLALQGILDHHGIKMQVELATLPKPA